MLSTTIQETRLEVDGLRIRCFVAGESGSPVVLLHGGGLDSARLSWQKVIGPLAEGHRVFAPDLPGYGESDHPAIEYTMDYYISFLADLLDALHLERVSLVGLSLGGGIALGFALCYPERVEKLVPVAPYGILDRVSVHKLSYLFVQLPLLDELSYWLIGRSRRLVRWTLLASLIYKPEHLSPEIVEEVCRLARERNAGRAFISFQRNEVQWSGLRSDFIGRLSEISAPTLLIHGSHDTAVPGAQVERAHRLIKGSELYVMQDCRHWPMEEQPEEFNRIVLDFLDRQAPSAQSGSASTIERSDASL
jgi:pimeloyl-ACP methyl ester carboxylesterase